MKLFEGAKVSQKLVREAVNDPQSTLGFETEFFVRGVTEFLERIHLQNADRNPQSGWIEKKLADMTWYDLLKYFVPLDVEGKDGRDNQNVMVDRLNYYFGHLYPNDHTTMGFSAKFAKIREKTKPYHLLAALKAYPGHGFNLSRDDQEQIMSILERGRIAQLIAGYRDLDNQTFRMFLDDEAVLQADVENDMITREILYHALVEPISDYLGEEVRVVMNSENTKRITGNYQTWAIAMDDSLMSVETDRVGIELISPVKQSREGLIAMQKVLQLLNDFEQLGLGMTAETTEKTGFHINIGFGDRNVDYVKMLFLMGDEYIAKNYNRIQFAGEDNQMFAQTLAQMLKTAGNQSMKLVPILNRLEQNLTLDQNDIREVMALFRASTPKEKLQTVNLSKLEQGFIEFRSAGNADYHKHADKLIRTTIHLITMVYIAVTPHVYRREYLSKLYKAAMDLLVQHRQRQSKVDDFIDHDMMGNQRAVNEEAEMREFYHVTPKRNLHSILKHGLVPHLGDRSQKVETIPAIHLFRSMDELEDAVMNWLGDEFEEDEPLIVLSVRVPENAVEEDVFYPGAIYISKEPIPVRALKLVRNDV